MYGYQVATHATSVQWFAYNNCCKAKKDHIPLFQFRGMKRFLHSSSRDGRHLLLICCVNLKYTFSSRASHRLKITRAVFVTVNKKKIQSFGSFPASNHVRICNYDNNGNLWKISLSLSLSLLIICFYHCLCASNYE